MCFQVKRGKVPSGSSWSIPESFTKKYAKKTSIGSWPVGYPIEWLLLIWRSRNSKLSLISKAEPSHPSEETRLFVSKILFFSSSYLSHDYRSDKLAALLFGLVISSWQTRTWWPECVRMLAKILLFHSHQVLVSGDIDWSLLQMRKHCLN